MAQWNLTCSESILKCSESLQVPVRPCFYAPSFYRNRCQQHPRTSEFKEEGIGWNHMPRAGWEKILIKKISHRLSANLFGHFLGHSEGESDHCAARGAVAGALGPLPNCPSAAQHHGRGAACAAEFTCLGSTRASARGFSGTLNLAFYFPVPLNFISKTKAIIFPTSHS